MRVAAWVLAAVVFGGAARPAGAQTGPLAPTGGPPEQRPALAFDPSPTGQLPPEPDTTPVTTTSSRPPNVLGPPVLGAPVRPSDRDPVPAPPPARPAAERPAFERPAAEPIRPVANTESEPITGRRGGLGVPAVAGRPVRAEAVENAPRGTRSSYEAPPDPVGELLTKRGAKGRGDAAPASGADEWEQRTADRDRERPSWKFGDKLGGMLGDRTDWFRSDHAFDGFISPVTNPFLFEDPRSLTEVRPMFMYQSIPSGQPDFQGGGVWFFGTQARVAFTDRLSFVFNKIGGLSFNPGSGSSYDSNVGFAELWLGPKYTILRGENTGSLLAAGLQFQVPIGSSAVFQDTGSLSLVPYLTYGQNFGRDWRIGSMNTIVATGYSFGTDDQRSDYYWLSAHLDLDVMNNHRFYPLAEMNWYYYTANGNARPIGTEGRDLFNFGGQSKDVGLLTGAVGARFKITESAQVGAAFEFPLAGPRDTFHYRATVDFILRY